MLIKNADLAMYQVKENGRNNYQFFEKDMNVRALEQVAFLQAHGCDEGQGYYFSRPIPASQFAKLLEAGTTIGLPN